MCKLKNIDLLYWVTEIIGIALTAVVGFMSIEICIPALYTNLLISQKIAMIIGFLFIVYKLGQFFGKIMKSIRKKLRAAFK